MSATIRLKDFLSSQPNYRPGWRLIVNGAEMPHDAHWRVESRFGSVELVVVDGKTPFDRPEYREAPFAQAVVWGRDRQGKVRVALVDQRRPHADAPGQYLQPCEPVLFRHVPMGFANKLVEGFETGAEAAKREAGEEVGVSKILSIVEVPFGHNPSPSFTPTWGGVAFIEVDLSQIIAPEENPNEPIEGRYWMLVADLLSAIKSGKSDDTGAYLGVATSLSALMLFFAHFPQFLAE